MILVKSFEELCALDPATTVLVTRWGHCSNGSGDEETGFGTEIGVGHVVRFEESTKTAYIGPEPSERYQCTFSVGEDEFVSALKGTKPRMHALGMQMLQLSRPTDVFAR